MSETYHLAYLFTTFAVGSAILGGAIVLARLRHDELARGFLALYVPLSIAVLAALFLRVAVTRPTASPVSLFVLEYLEAFVGRYGVMLGLILFAHRLFAIRDRRRTMVLVALVLFAFAAQHATEYLLGERWDARGDLLEDLLAAGVLGYTVWLGVRHMHDDRVYHRLARAFVVLLSAAVPLLVHDIFLIDGPGFRLYPLWYGLLGAATIWILVGRRSAGAARIPPEWHLSARERDVVHLVERGLTNEAIAGALAISANTVKTHLRAIFQKSGFRSRVALIATLSAAAPDADHTDGRRTV